MTEDEQCTLFREVILSLLTYYGGEFSIGLYNPLNPCCFMLEVYEDANGQQMAKFMIEPHEHDGKLH